MHASNTLDQILSMGLITSQEPKVKVIIPMYEPLEVQKTVGCSDFSNQIFLFAKTALKDFPQWSKSPIVSSVLFPLLPGLPAIMHACICARRFLPEDFSDLVFCSMKIC